MQPMHMLWLVLCMQSVIQYIHMLLVDEIDSVCKCQIQIDIHLKSMTGRKWIGKSEDMTKKTEGEPITKCSYFVYRKSLLWYDVCECETVCSKFLNVYSFFNDMNRVSRNYCARISKYSNLCCFKMNDSYPEAAGKCGKAIKYYR